MKLVFPENDERSNGKPFNDDRPYLRQGAICKSAIRPMTKNISGETVPLRTSNVKAVKFVGAKDYDLVSPVFLKT